MSRAASNWAIDFSAAFSWANVRQVLGSRMLMGVFIGQYGINVLTYFFVTWFPTYLVNVRGMDFLNAGMMTMLPYSGASAGVLAAGLSAAVVGRHRLAREAAKRHRRFFMGRGGEGF